MNGAPQFLDVDPRTLHVPSSRRTGTDPVKLQRQIARFGAGSSGMPPPLVYECADGMITDGVTRATRVAKLSPGSLIRVEVIGRMPNPRRPLPTIGDLLP